MKLACRIFAIALLVVVLGTGMYVFAEEVYEAIQDIQTEALLEKALESVETDEVFSDEDMPEETFETDIEYNESSEDFAEEDLQQSLPEKKKRLEIDSTKVLERTAAIKDKDALEKYINANIMYNITDEENAYLMKLMKRGYDIERAIEIYSFLQSTKADLTMLERMYTIGSDTGFSDYWLENAYAVASGRESDELSVEDIFYYTNNGITPDEIAMAYELSLYSDKPIRKILDPRIAGASWAEIVATCNIDISINKDTFADKENLREINSIISIAKTTGNYVADVIDNDEIFEEYAYKIQEVRDTCETMGITPVKGGRAQ